MTRMSLAILGETALLQSSTDHFFWPGMSKHVRKLCRNCDICGRSHVWREQKKGLLRPLPIPDRFNKELAIDFMTDLPARSIKDPRYMMVIIDQWRGSVLIEEMHTMKAEDCATFF